MLLTYTTIADSTGWNLDLKKAVKHGPTGEFSQSVQVQDLENISYYWHSIAQVPVVYCHGMMAA